MADSTKPISELTEQIRYNLMVLARMIGVLPAGERSPLAERLIALSNSIDEFYRWLTTFCDDVAKLRTLTDDLTLQYQYMQFDIEATLRERGIA